MNDKETLFKSNLNWPVRYKIKSTKLLIVQIILHLNFSPFLRPLKDEQKFVNIIQFTIICERMIFQV